MHDSKRRLAFRLLALTRHELGFSKNTELAIVDRSPLGGALKEEIMKKLLRFVVVPVLATALTLAGGVAQASGKLEVDKNDPDCSNIYGDPFCDIQPAVDAASPGDKIKVEQGTYTENVLITTADIRLRGEDATLDGTILGGIGIHVLGTSGVKIRGFIVENFDIGVVLTNVYHSRLRDIETRFNDDPADGETPFSHDGLQLFGSDGNLIKDVFAHDNGHNGITLAEGSSNNTLEENISNLNGTNPNIPTFGCGIELRSDRNNNNSITENEILANGWGILLGFGGGRGADDNIIEENEIHGNARTGIDVKDGSSGNFMIENDATSNAGFSDAFSLDFDLNDGGSLDNTWEDNAGISSF